jgi:segregation and condensation protein A
VSAGPYAVRLDGVAFEGPLDLLLFLIRRNEIDVHDIPIALVTDQFLAYLERMDPSQLEAAGEFLAMAATLLRIKTRMLLPAPQEPDAEDLEDPRSELVARILEYQQVRELARGLRDREVEAARQHPRGAIEPVEAAPAPVAEPAERRVTLKDLLRAFAAALAARPAEPVHRVEPVRITLEDRLRHVRAVLAERGAVLFHELFPPEAARLELVVTLVALLEMVRGGEVVLRQDAVFEEIAVVPRAVRAPDAGRAAPDEAGGDEAGGREARGGPAADGAGEDDGPDGRTGAPWTG